MLRRPRSDVGDLEFTCECAVAHFAPRGALSHLDVDEIAAARSIDSASSARLCRRPFSGSASRSLGNLRRLMRNHFDYGAKQIGREALEPSGTTVIHDEISPETLHADIRHEPVPAHTAERARLGLLGRLSSVVCLLEIYGHAPSAEEFRACLAKHIASWQEPAPSDPNHKHKTVA